MPHSLVLNLLPESPIPPGFLTGKHLHALFLSLVSSVDQAMGDDLHTNQANKSFTLSPLQIARSSHHVVKHQTNSPGPISSATSDRPLRWQYGDPVAPGTPCWWRVSLLDDRLFSQLNKLWLNLNPSQPWHLGPANLHITSILGTPQSTQPWANFCSYQQIYEEASDHNRRLTFQFYTPTAFRQGKYDSAMPTPEAVFGSLLRRWNHYSGIPFTPDLIGPLQSSFFDIRTEVATDPRSQFQHTGARIDPAKQFMGCVGRVTFQILGSVEVETIKQINALADFALYAGIGRKTPMGMGMTRRVA
ncbi:MAG TPA: CRISPR-associated endoribonuclease Cas6 [Leptolyngbyaceae cyanobacterium]